MGKFLAVASFHNNPDEHIDLTFTNVLKQTHQDWLLIVADDGSKDPEFRRKLRKRVERLNDKRIIYYHLENRRELYLYQNTFQHLDYDYYFDLDSDDILHEELFEVYDEHFKRFPKVQSIFCDYEQRNEDGNLEQWSLVQEPHNYKEEWYLRHKGEFWDIYRQRNTQKMFGHGRCMRKPNVDKLPIQKECKTATDTYFLFYNLTRGQHLHIPRNLYTYNRRENSDSGKMTEAEHLDFNTNALPFIESYQDASKVAIYNDVWHVTSAIQTCDWLSKVSSLSVWADVTPEQEVKIQLLYPKKEIVFNQPHDNVIVAQQSSDLSDISRIGDFKRLSILALKEADGIPITQEDLNKWMDVLQEQAFAFAPDGNWYAFFRQFRFTVDRVKEMPEVEFFYRSGPELRCGNVPKDRSYTAQFWLKDKMYYSNTISTNVWMRYAMDYWRDWECRIVDTDTEEVIQVLKPDQKVFGVQFDSSSLGDTISWMGQVEEMLQQRDFDKVYVRLHKPELFNWKYYERLGIYPVTWDEYWPKNWQCLGIYQPEGDPAPRHKHPRDWRTINLGAVAADQLGIRFVERRPKMSRRFYERDLIEAEETPSVCIAPSSTAAAKEWQRPAAWQTLVDNFNSNDWKVYHCSKEETNLTGVERASDGGPDSIFKVGQQISHSGKFIGLASGLSWLAWALKAEVCLISGFSYEWVEFEANIRIINKNVCHGCWTWDRFDRGDWWWCPQNKGTEKAFECTKTISPEYVWQELETAGWFNI
tara:strand:- start:481 stop:2751 length:2271 start_codon:yes stop_codon:yes gene_type:complete